MRNLTRHWLMVNLRAKQGEVGRGGTPAREISFVSFMAYGPNSDSALTMGGYNASGLSQAGEVRQPRD